MLSIGAKSWKPSSLWRWAQICRVDLSGCAIIRHIVIYCIFFSHLLLHALSYFSDQLIVVLLAQKISCPPMYSHWFFFFIPLAPNIYSFQFLNNTIAPCTEYSLNNFPPPQHIFFLFCSVYLLYANLKPFIPWICIFFSSVQYIWAINQPYPLW